MKKRFLLSCITLCSVVLGAMAQRSYTFNAAALNVDGLPNEILGIEINPDGKEDAGATELCGILANSGWDIVGFSEDFNFHSYLVAAPASTFYNFGEHGGSVSGLSNSTDGLGFACAKRFTMAGGTKVKWNDHYGETDHGADGLITKGFRVYNVTLAQGIVVDVYVLHMDAEDSAEDIAARKKQLTQLATYIKDNHNNRPVIILGDTNCRYTRDELKTAFVDVINADSRFTIKDAWVELIWGGTYPTYGSGAMMTHEYGMQKGEIVDKVFYINTTASNLKLKANSYLHDESVTTSDHKPVVVNFTLTDPNGTPLTDAEKENNWTLEESVAGNKKPTWEGEQVVSGTTYYMMNVGTGEYIKWGGAYLTEGVAGNAGTPIKAVANGNVWNLQTSTARANCYLGDGDYTYLDRPVGESNWYLEPVSGTAYQYRLKSSRNLYLTATTTEAHHPVKSEAYNANNENQKWVFLTDARIRTEMTKANADYPFNFTALLKSADFDLIEYEDGWTNNWDGFDWSGGGTNNMTGDGPFKGASSSWSADASQYVSYAYANSTNETTMSQDLGTLPNGTYNISFEGFYRSRYKPFLSSEKDETRNAVVSFGSTNIAIPQNTSTAIGAGTDVVAPLFRDGDTYLKSQQVTMSSSSSVTLKVTKPATSSTAKGAWICIDNFRLMYHGTGTAPIDPYKEFKDKVRTKVNETYPKVKELNAAGQAAYDIATVVSRYNNDQINSAADANAMCDMVDNAYANAYAAHRAYILEHAYDNLGADGDISSVIVNPSFETGDLTGWTVFRGAQDTGVTDKQNATGMDGSYLFNTWDNQGYGCGIIYQDVTGLRNGHYVLQAMVTSWADRKAYIVANDQHVGVATTAGEKVFVDLSLDFLVENGTARIGAVGGNEGNDFYYKQGIFYKVDHFRLAYKGDVGQGRVEIALATAKAEADKLGEAAKAQFNAAVAQYENASVSGDGKAEETAIYAALKAAIATQTTAGTDMTWLITNPGFETGDWTGWTKPTAWDGVVLHATHGNAPGNGEGQYVVNVWNDFADAPNSGINQPTYQTLTGLPNGHYRLTADVASDGGNQVCVYATAGDKTVNGAASPENNWTFVEATVEFEVTNGTATIGAVGLRQGEFNIEGGCWYKCDNFRLTYVAPIAVEKVTLNDTEAVIVENTTLQLTATVTPDYATDKTVTWSSSDDEIATVDQNGKITAKVPGNVTITATSGDKSASCAVTVDYASYVFTLNVEDEVYFTETVKRATSLATVLEENEVVEPTKAGYTFSGWDVPETMPANDLTLNGTYTVNKYTVTFQIGEEVISSEELEYGAAIEAPEAPAKEGYTFDGWGEVAKTVPAENVTYTGSYTVNKYTVTFQIGDEVISEKVLEYGAAIEAPEAPAKEGYTFNGWGEVAETVPAEDVTYTGSYTVNKYTVVFQIGEEVISSVELEYGAAIEAPEAPAKEGYTFNGWGEVAKTVPAEDVTYTGSYTVNKYTVVFQIGEEVISEKELEYGAAIEAPEAPAKEGYTFDGWGEVAETVPAEHVVYEGSYTVNKYKVYYIINGEEVYVAEVEYGAAIEIPEELAAMYPGFEWMGEDPEEVYVTMPAYDIYFTGNDVTGLDRTAIDSQAVIYDLSGRRVLEAVKGFYIINGKKVLIK